MGRWVVGCQYAKVGLRPTRGGGVDIRFDMHLHTFLQINRVNNASDYIVVIVNLERGNDRNSKFCALHDGGRRNYNA